MVQHVLLKKEHFQPFVRAVMKKFEVIAPVAGDESKLDSQSMFKEIRNPEEIDLSGITFFPVKHFFFDKREVLFQFDGNKVFSPVIELNERVFFGLRRCDLNSIRHQDTVFLKEHEDPFYKVRREASLLIGHHCKDPYDEYCFCNSIPMKDCFDLMMYEKGDGYGIEIGTEKGRKLIKDFSSFFLFVDDFITAEDKVTINHKSLNSLQIKHLYQRAEWETLSDICFSCAACTELCPNCHCFTIQDEVNFDLKSGERVRVPASCQLPSFSRVAGDHVFRESRLARFKHRIYHQIEYFRDKHQETFCTGCGRCIRGCPVRIDWVELINTLSGGT